LIGVSSRIARIVLAGFALGGALFARSAAAQQQQGADPAANRIRPGDRIVVKYVGTPGLPDTVMVGANGNAVIPKLGAVDVSIFTVDEAPDSIRARLGKFMRNPEVDLLVLRRVVVSGEVKRPDVYLVDAHTTLADAIAHAGGVNEFGNPGKVTLVRGTTTTELKDWDKPGANLGQLHSGDEIIVGRKSWLSLNVLPAVSTLAVVTSILFSILRK
jgi:polysaccharide export outer membrane protein